MLVSFLVQKLFTMPFEIALNKSIEKAVNKMNQIQAERYQNNYSSNYSTVVFGYKNSIKTAKLLTYINIFYGIFALFILIAGMPILSLVLVANIFLFLWFIKVVRNKAGVAVYSTERIFIIKNKSENYIDFNNVIQLKFSMSKGLVFVTRDSKDKIFFPCGGKGYLDFIAMLEQYHPHLVQTLSPKQLKEQKEYFSYYTN